MRPRECWAVAALAGLALMSGCGADHPIAPIETSYLGAWGYDFSASGNGVRVYDRLEPGSAVADFEILAGGLLWMRHRAYLGGDFPTGIWCEGIWHDEAANLLLLTYSYQGQVHSYRLTVFSVNSAELHCNLAEVGMGWSPLDLDGGEW
ncbi:hypothetical protein KJ682_07075 [bacterium]|nr:hypothetical protein [bacterium]